MRWSATGLGAVSGKQPVDCDASRPGSTSSASGPKPWRSHFQEITTNLSRAVRSPCRFREGRRSRQQRRSR